MFKSTSIKKQLMKGFTLIELLIVVIILAILAAIVVPQFSSSTNDAKLSSLKGTLGAMRSAIDLYYQQHGKYPGDAASSGAPAACTAAPTGAAAGTQDALLEQLAYYTNINGQACKMKGTGGEFQFGPYIKKSAAPTNPITKVSTIAISIAGALDMAGTNATGTGGWKVDTKTGQFIADDTRLIPPSTTATYDKL